MYESQQARAAELAVRKAAWEASRGIAPAAPAAPPPPPPRAATPEPEPVRAPRAPRPLPPDDVVESVSVAHCLGLALEKRHASEEAPFREELLSGLSVVMGERGERAEGVERPRFVICAEEHADEVLMACIGEEGARPLAYLLAVYQRCVEEAEKVLGNRRYGEKLKGRVGGAVQFVRKACLLYVGMTLNGSFSEERHATPEALAAVVMKEDAGLPAGFVSALLDRYSAEDAPGIEELRGVFIRLFMAIRAEMVANGKLSGRGGGYLKALKALNSMLASDRRLCVWLTEDDSFCPEAVAGMELRVGMWSSMSFLAPFFSVSVLPGLPLHAPSTGCPEDPETGVSYFPNPTMASRADVDSAVTSLRATLGVARQFLNRIGALLCRAGDGPRDKTMTWFSTILNLNMKRLATQPDYSDTSPDGFMMNVLHVLLKLAEPVVQGGWSKLERVDPTFPQSSYRIDYSDETRLAADSDMLKRWWVDKRNKNAQESLTRQMEHATREAAAATAGGSASASQAGASASDAPPGDAEMDDVALEAPKVSTDFKFVTEIYFVTLRAVQLGFMPINTLYQETLLRSLNRMRDMVKDLEDTVGRTQMQERQLHVMKARFDALLQAKFCYDVYIKDDQMLESLVRFVSGSAEWLVKKLLVDPSRPNLLPLPTPPPAIFASLPEHVVESMSTVLITTMHHVPEVIDRCSDALDNILTFAIAAASSPLHVKNPYLRAKLVEFISSIFPQPIRSAGAGDDDDGALGPPTGYRNPEMETLFLGHTLSCKFLPSAVFRLYVDVEHTGSHTQFYDKFSIRYQIGSILEVAWNMPVYRHSIRLDAADETRFMQFVNMLLNDANHLLDETLDNLEEIHRLEKLVNSTSSEWTSLSDEEKEEKTSRLESLYGQARSYNQLSNNNVKLLYLLTDDDIVRKVFLRPEMVSRIAEMLTYLLKRLCGDRCRDLVVTDPERVEWKPRMLLSRVLKTFLHFQKDRAFAAAVGRDGRSYSPELLERASSIAARRGILSAQEVVSFREIAAATAQVLVEDAEDETDLGDIPEEFLDPIMSTIMENPVKLPTSGNVMDRDVISRILLSDKLDPFNRAFLSEDMLEDDVELKARITEFRSSRKRPRE